MVDVQSISMTLAALSFIVAAIYYAMNLREVSRNRRVTLTTTLLQPFMTEEGNRLFMDLWEMEWRDLEEYKSKYDHRASPENYAKRSAVWNRFNSARAPNPKQFSNSRTRARAGVIGEREGGREWMDEGEFVAESLWKSERIGLGLGARI